MLHKEQDFVFYLCYTTDTLPRVIKTLTSLYQILPLPQKKMTTVLSMMPSFNLPLTPPPVLYATKNSGSCQEPSLAPFINQTIPRYVHKYPQIFNVVQSMHSVINEWKPDTALGTYELEVRFGKWQGQYFKSGVSKSFIEKILAMFDTCSHWTSVLNWEESHDYYYGLPNDKELIRTTAVFQTDPGTGRKRIVTKHIRKRNRYKADYMYVMTGGNSIDMHKTLQLFQDFQYDVRVNLNYEEKVQDNELPSIINPSSVRIKSRKSYLYKSDEFPSSDPLWRFDLTRSWTASSRSEAEMKQKNGETVYEFELECLNPLALMVSPKHDTFYVACSMMLKMKDFLTYAGSSDFKWDPIERISPLTQDINCF